MLKKVITSTGKWVYSHFSWNMARPCLLFVVLPLRDVGTEKRPLGDKASVMSQRQPVGRLWAGETVEGQGLVNLGARAPAHGLQPMVVMQECGLNGFQIIIFFQRNGKSTFLCKISQLLNVNSECLRMFSRMNTTHLKVGPSLLDFCSKRSPWIAFQMDPFLHPLSFLLPPPSLPLQKNSLKSRYQFFRRPQTLPEDKMMGSWVNFELKRIPPILTLTVSSFWFVTSSSKYGDGWCRES